MIFKFAEKEISFEFFLPKILIDDIKSLREIQCDFLIVNRKKSKMIVVYFYASFEYFLKG